MTKISQSRSELVQKTAEMGKSHGFKRDKEQRCDLRTLIVAGLDGEGRRQIPGCMKPGEGVGHHAAISFWLTASRSTI
jgi:hypothetical protein